MQNPYEFYAETLRQGGLGLFPTDTVWALGCDATNEPAVQQLRRIKQLPEGEGLICLVDSLARLQEYVDYVPIKAANLIEYYLRPLTIIYPEVSGLAEQVRHADGSVAFRVTRDPVCCQLIAHLGAPLVASVAAPYGHAVPKAFAHIEPTIVQAANFSTDGHQQGVSEAVPSIIIRISPSGDLVFIRK